MPILDPPSDLNVLICITLSSVLAPPTYCVANDSILTPPTYHVATNSTLATPIYQFAMDSILTPLTYHVAIDSIFARSIYCNIIILMLPLIIVNTKHLSLISASCSCIYKTITQFLQRL